MASPAQRRVRHLPAAARSSGSSRARASETRMRARRPGVVRGRLPTARPRSRSPQGRGTWMHFEKPAPPWVHASFCRQQMSMHWWCAHLQRPVRRGSPSQSSLTRGCGGAGRAVIAGGEDALSAGDGAAAGRMVARLCSSCGEDVRPSGGGAAASSGGVPTAISSGARRSAPHPTPDKSSTEAATHVSGSSLTWTSVAYATFATALQSLRGDPAPTGRARASSAARTSVHSLARME
jgi:hypothetical protein